MQQVFLGPFNPIIQPKILLITLMLIIAAVLLIARILLFALFGLLPCLLLIHSLPDIKGDLTLADIRNALVNLLELLILNHCLLDLIFLADALGVSEGLI